MKSIKEYILLERGNTPKVDLSKRVMHKSAGDNNELYIGKDNKLLYTNDIITYPEPTNNAYELIELNVVDKRNGYGTQLVKELVKIADADKKDIVVYASPLGDHISEDDLIDFYKKCGFEQDNRLKDKQCLIYKHK